MGFFDSIFGFIGSIFEFAFGWLIPEPETQSQSIKASKVGSNKPVPVNYGENILGAIKIHQYVTDTPEESDNDLLHIIAVFCEGEVDGVQELFFNEISENDKKFTGGRLAGNKWYSKEVYNGTPNQPASAAAVSGIPNWTIDHKLSGLCYAYIVLQLPWEESDERREVWKGEPQISARIKGKKVYDPRTDTTVYSANPALCIRDFITNPIYGLGLPESFVVDSEIERIANACDEGVSTTQTITDYIIDDDPTARPIPITTTTTVTHPRFSCNLVLQTEDNPLENFNKILRTFRGIAQDMTSSAKLSYETTIEETYGAGTTVNDLFHFNADTMLDDFEFDSGDIKDRFNVVEVKFRNRLKAFEEDSVFFPSDGDPLKSQWLAEDNGIEQKGDFTVSGITSKAEALQWAEVVAKRSRFTKSVSVTGMPITIKVEVGDIVAVDSQMNGWTKKPFRVMEKELQDDDSVAFKLREHEDAIYPWSGRSFSDTVGGTWLGDPNNLAAVTGITLTPDQTLSKTGTLSWSYGANAFIRGYQVRLKDGDGNLLYDVQRPSRSWLIPLIDAGSYVAEVYAVSTTGATSPTAAYAFTLAAPVQPSSITLTARDWEIEAAAQLAGIGLGTVFEYDIVAGDGTGHTPSSQGRASTFTFTGLLPDTLYTVFARAINAYGISAWISASATTTNTGAQVEPYLDTIREELDDVETRFDEVQTAIDDIDFELPDINDYLDQVSSDANILIKQTDDNRAAVKRITDVQSQADGTAIALSIVEGQVNNPETNASAMFAFVQQAQQTADGAQSSVSIIENKVDDPTTGLSATFALAGEAKQTADGNFTAVGALTVRVDDAESDISAQAGLIAQAQSGVDGNFTAITNLTATVEDPTTGLSATNTLAQQAYAYADGNFTALTQLDARVEDNENFAAAQVQLNAGYDSDLGTLFARAALVTDVNNRITGVIIDDDGIDRTIEFVSDSVTFVDGSGVAKIYYDLNNNRYVFDGHIVAQTGTFSGQLGGATGTFSGVVSGGGFEGGYITIGGLNKDNFVVDYQGNITQAGGYYRTAPDTSPQPRVLIDGRPWAGGGTTAGRYAIWIGTGTTTAGDPLFYIDKAGNGFIKGEFFQGQIIETRYGSASGALPITATASTHYSAGNPVEITGTVTRNLVMSGDTSGQASIISLTFKRGSTTVGTVEFQSMGFYNSSTNQTRYVLNNSFLVIDTGNSATGLSYSVTATSVSGPSGTVVSQTNSCSVKTFENKMG